MVVLRNIAALLVLLSVVALVGCRGYFGIFDWARTWGGEGHDYGSAVAVDRSGNVYVTGTFDLTVDFDPGPGIDEQTDEGIAGGFVSKFDSAGEYQWARTWWGDPRGWTRGRDVAVDRLGDVYVTGHFNDTMVIEEGDHTIRIPSVGDLDVFLLKLGASGDTMWVRTWGGDEPDLGKGLAIDRSGNVYVTGFFRSTVDFDPGPALVSRTSSGVNTIFVSKFDSAGNLLWVTTWGGEGLNWGSDLAATPDGRCWVTGAYSLPAGPEPMQANDAYSPYGRTRGFLSSIDSSGEIQWTRVWGVAGRGLALDSVGNVYVSGVFSDRVDFDPGNGVTERTNEGRSDSYLSKFDSNGDFLWVRSWGGDASGEAIDVAADRRGNVYVCGRFRGTVDYAPGPGIHELESSESTSFYLTSLDSAGTFQWVYNWASSDEASYFADANGVCVDTSGRIYLTGAFSYDVDFDPEYGEEVHCTGENDEGADIFLLRLTPYSD